MKEDGARDQQGRVRKSGSIRSQVDPSQSAERNMDAVEINTSDPPQGEDAIASDVKICRVCLLDNLMMRDLFVGSEIASLSAKAMSFVNVKVRCVI